MLVSPTVASKPDQWSMCPSSKDVVFVLPLINYVHVLKICLIESKKTLAMHTYEYTSLPIVD